MKFSNKIFYFFSILLLLTVKVDSKAQYGSDIGPSTISTLKWEYIDSFIKDPATASSIGLTKDKKVYVWGTNTNFSIHGNSTSDGFPKWQTTPYYVPTAAGETAKKVRIHAGSINISTGASYSVRHPMFAYLTESGKLYAWGVNTGLAGSAWVQYVEDPQRKDSTRATRTPTLLTIPSESTPIVDFDIAKYYNFMAVVASSGKAYIIGSNGTSAIVTTFTQLPIPTGANASTFKYTNVWADKSGWDACLYLKGNDGKIYYTGSMQQGNATGVPSLYDNLSLTTNEVQGRMTLIAPREVPFPAGEDIIDIKVYGKEWYTTNYAISASGKAYMAGIWQVKYYNTTLFNDYRTYVVAPLKTAPLTAQLGRYKSGGTDSVYVLKQFLEIAMPVGSTKIIDVERGRLQLKGNNTTIVLTDDKKAYWSGQNDNVVSNFILVGNYLSNANETTNMGSTGFECKDIKYVRSSNPYQWEDRAINYDGAVRINITGESNYDQYVLISSSGTGYFVGWMSANTGTGKIQNSTTSYYISAFPVPIANELLADCNTRPGTGGPVSVVPVAPTNTAVGTIDCSKTQLSPAPSFGTAGQLDLIVTINVTTAGNFTPITVTGSGMTVANNITAITTATTGIQTFHIPMNYDGTALGTMNFTVGSAGSCSADLTTQPTQVIKNVWTLSNCSAIVPGTISK